MEICEVQELYEYNDVAKGLVSKTQNNIDEFKPVDRFLSVVPLTPEEKKFVEQYRNRLLEMKKTAMETVIPCDDFYTDDNLDPSFKKHFFKYSKLYDMLGELLVQYEQLDKLVHKYGDTGIYNFPDKSTFNFGDLTSLINKRPKFALGV
ncbi:hypothetical protein GOV12_05220 [Candidatus Pacearchaeota archaeon]|nr:hypothetical protein [Candidatus Pacearchaeota archaeon]